MSATTAARPSRLAAVLVFIGAAGLAACAVQPPVEVEDPKGTVKKKIVVEDEDPKGPPRKKITVDDDPVIVKKTPDALPGSAPDVRLDELVRAAEDARAPALKALFAKYAVPFDRLHVQNNVLRIRPIPIRKAEWPAGQDAIGVVPLDNANKPLETRPIPVPAVKSVDHFETMVQAEAEALLKKAPDGVTTGEQQFAAEKLLAAALRFHDYARERNIRRGKTWDDVRTPIAEKLRDLRLELLRSAVAANDAARVRELTSRMSSAYPRDPVIAREVATARVGEVERLLQSGSHFDHVRAKELLDEFESRFPGAGGDAVRRCRNQIADIAIKAFTRAKEKKAVGDLTTARDELARAAALDPGIAGVRDLQRELRSGYPVLVVGVRQYPHNMSPATARLDSEKQAVELMFEGLLEEVPGETGAVRYRPGAAIGMPAVVPGGRECIVRSFDRDPANRPGFDSHDVVGTLKLLDTASDLWAAYPLPWLAGLPTPSDANAVRIPFALGHPDPRALLTFKLLPTKWLAENGKRVDDAGFAEKPFGTGPFRLYSNPRPDPAIPREMVFVDNPLYSRWRDRTGLPHLREIRLVEVSKIDPVEAFRTDKLHILTDVPTNELDRFVGPAAGLNGKVQVVTAAVNRRVHILAVNLHRSYMQSKVLRQGLSLAIDRDEVLGKVFRANRADLHRAMTGPFPPNSWAAPRGLASVPLVNRDLAVARLKAYLADAGAKTDLTLSYPEDDPRAAAACAQIQAHVKDIQRDFPNGRKVVINLEGVPLAELVVRVQDEHRYDLAYVPFDYPDDWHPYALGAALDRSAAGRGGRNWFGFLLRETNPDADDQSLGELLTQIRGYRDFAGQLVPKSTEAARLFNDCLPFIPLWQIDRHTIVHSSLKVYVDDSAEPANPRVLNPTTLFQGVARWRLE